jgi:hypothetical protein
VSVCFFSILVPLYCHEDDSRISDLVGIFSGLVVTVGTVSVLQYDEESNEIVTLPYCIPAHITLGKPSFDF